jgi:hypothetical protein
MEMVHTIVSPALTWQNYTYKSKEVMCAENYSVKQHCICQSVSYFTISLLVVSYYP